jgi:hypothetical protein
MSQSVSPPGDAPMEPNQYNTPCRVVFYNGNQRERKFFSDLQMAYMSIQNTIQWSAENWNLMDWETTIRKMYEHHMEDRSGTDVAACGNMAFCIYYEI